jgi:cytochrome o ubiquinol oxidase subunit 1
MLIPGALFGYFAGYMYWFPKAFGFTLDERWGVRSFWCWLIGFYLAFMPLYALGFMGMPRRMEHYNVAAWQPYLVVAALGACLVLLGIVCLAVQLADLSGDPWNGRTLEWLTASPPAPYNFAVLPDVRDLDALYEMKARGVAWQRPQRYEDIEMPKNSSAGVVLGGLAFLLGFAMVWQIWWLAIACGLGAAITVIVRSWDDEAEYRIPATEVAKIEDERYRMLAAARTQSTAGGVVAGPRLRESPT